MIWLSANQLIDCDCSSLLQNRKRSHQSQWISVTPCPTRNPSFQSLFPKIPLPDLHSLTLPRSMNHCWLLVWINFKTSIFAFVWLVVDILLKFTQFVKLSPKPSLPITRSMSMSRAKMSSRRLWSHMIGHYLWRILDVQNPRNLEVQVREQDTKSRTVKRFTRSGVSSKGCCRVSWIEWNICLGVAYWNETRLTWPHLNILYKLRLTFGNTRDVPIDSRQRLAKMLRVR